MRFPRHACLREVDATCRRRLPCESRTSSRHAREGKAGESPRTPSVVSRAREPKPTNRAHAHVDRERSSAHPFAFSRLVLRVRRGFRASFWLASCDESSTKSCDFEVGKARDATDRLLPPMRNCVYPYLACSRFTPRLSPRGRHPRLRDGSIARARSLGLRVALPGDRVFHDTRERFSGSQGGHALPCPLSSCAILDCARGSERGRCLPTAPIAIEPLTPLSPLHSPQDVGAPSPSFDDALSSLAFPREEAAEVAVTTAS